MVTLLWEATPLNIEAGAEMVRQSQVDLGEGQLANGVQFGALEAVLEGRSLTVAADFGVSEAPVDCPVAGVRGCV